MPQPTVASPPVSKDEWIAQAKEVNPTWDTAALAQKFDSIYPSTPSTDAPIPKNEWVMQAAEHNPTWSPDQLGKQYDTLYPPVAPPAPIGLGGTVLEGVKGMARSVSSFGNALVGNDAAIVDASQAQQVAPVSPEQQALQEDIAAKKAANPDRGLLETGASLGTSFLAHPSGSLHMLAGQLPNTGAILAGGAAGAAAGSVIPGVGTVVGGIAGMFLGNVALETGSKLMDAAADKTLTPEERSQALQEGLVKGGIITAVDMATLGLTKWMTGAVGRAVEVATIRTLEKAGVNTADTAAVKIARQDPAIASKVKEAQQLAVQHSTTAAKRVARTTGEAGLETSGEALGEYTGELAATGKGDITEAMLEGFMGLGTSAGEIGGAAAVSHAQRIATTQTPTTGSVGTVDPIAHVVAPIAHAKTVDEAIATAQVVAAGKAGVDTTGENIISGAFGTGKDVAPVFTQQEVTRDADQKLIETMFANESLLSKGETGETLFRGAPLRVLTTAELPQTVDPTAGGISQENLVPLQALMGLWGKRISVLQPTKTLMDGVVHKGMAKDVIFVSANTRAADVTSTLVHELFHHFEGSPLHRAFVDLVWENRTKEGVLLARNRHTFAKNEDDLKQEMASDIAGTELLKPEVVSKIVARLQERLGLEPAKAEIVGFLDHVNNTIARVKELIVSRPWSFMQKNLASLYVTNLEKVHDTMAAAAAEALYNVHVGTLREKAQKGTLALSANKEARTVVHPLVSAAFTKIAETQRVVPELAMLRVQRHNVGGVLNPVVEHAGDLLHRMTESAKYGFANQPTMKEKVDRLLRSLGHPYGFEKEADENLRNNAKAFGGTYAAFRDRLNASLKEYTKAHAALPVHNRAQWLAREVALAVGHKDFPTAIAHLKSLKEIVDSPTYTEHAFEHAMTPEGPAPYLHATRVSTDEVPSGAERAQQYTLLEHIPGHKEGETITRAQLLALRRRPHLADIGSRLSTGVRPEVSAEARTTLSTTVPSGAKSAHDALTQVWHISTADILASKGHVATLAAALRTYPMMTGKGTRLEVLAEFHKKVVNNLLWLYDLVPEEIRLRARKWYSGANTIAKEWAAQDGYHFRQHAGVMAVLSPQKDWFMNMGLADRVRQIVKNQEKTKWTPEMTGWVELYNRSSTSEGTKEGRAQLLKDARRLEGTTLGKMKDEDGARFVRVYDETYHSRTYRLVTPEGGFGDYARGGTDTETDLFGKKVGFPRNIAWGTFETIAKAVSMLRDGSNENIHDQLGDAHKVRSFFNNIAHPESVEGHVTIDTHAVAAAVVNALSGGSPEVSDNFGAAGSNRETGASGSYGVLADAYRAAAEKRKIPVHEFQSVTWEAVRSLFPWTEKKALQPKVEAIWKRVREGELSIAAARNEIYTLSGGIKKFAWEEGGEGLSPAHGGVSFDEGAHNGFTKSAGRTRLSQSGGVPGGEGVLFQPRRPYAGVGQAGRDLTGVPVTVSVDGEDVDFHAFKPAQDAALAYMKSAGLTYTPETVYHKLDKEQSTRLAKAYDEMAHEPNDPEVKAAYDAMIKETRAQYNAIVKTGLVVEFFPNNEDTYGNPRNAILDVVEHNHFYSFSTKAGFGSNANFDASANPLLQETDVVISGEKVLVNDLFRVVHDYFGHVKDGVGFRAEGEDNAWYSHQAMYSALARRAMTTETRGQNSWVNYGPHGEANRKASPKDTIYADQKTGLLPDWAVKRVPKEGTVGPRLSDAAKKEFLKGSTVKHPVFHTTTAEFTAFKNMGEIGIHLGTAGQARNRYEVKVMGDPTAHELDPSRTHATLKVYISLKKPLRMKDQGTWDSQSMRGDLAKKFPDDAKTANWGTPVKIRQFLQSKGYDGIVYKNTGESEGLQAFLLEKNEAYANWQEIRQERFDTQDPLSSEPSMGEISAEEEYNRAYQDYEEYRKANAEDSYIVFDPTQIKSATGNIGTFDKTTPDIRFSASVTKTPEFKAWFGKSVVKTRFGGPRVVYHGTTRDFEKFHIPSTGQNSNILGPWDVTRYAAFFAQEPALATEFANQGERDAQERGQRIVPVYLSITKPLDLREGINEEDVTALRDAGMNDRYIAGRSPKTMWELFDGEEGGEANVAFMKAAGYDGAIILETSGTGIRNTVSYVVFDPTQVKSATGNIGTFDKTNPDIRFSTSKPLSDSEIQRLWNEYAEAEESLLEAKRQHEQGVVTQAEYAQFKTEADGDMQRLRTLLQPYAKDWGIRFSTSKPPIGLAREDLPKGATVPNVDWDKAQANKEITADPKAWTGTGWGRGTPTVYQAYVPDTVEDMPRARTEIGYYDWKAFKKTGVYPPAVIVIGADGIKRMLVDGNHRVTYWRSKKFDHFPAWIVDFRKNVDVEIPRFSPRNPISPFPMTEPGFIDQWIRKLQDKDIDIKRVVEDIQAAGRVVADAINPIYAGEMYQKREQQRAADFTNDELRPLLERVAAAGFTLKQFDNFLHARHVVVDKVNSVLAAMNPHDPNNKALSGMSDTEANLIYKGARHAELEALSKEVDQIVETSRALLVDYGLESENTIKQWKKTYKAYVPLRREGFEDVNAYPTGTGKSVRGSTVQVRGGSTLGVESVLANIAQARDQIISRGEKQRPVIAFAAMLIQNPNEAIGVIDKHVQITIPDPVTGLPVVVADNKSNTHPQMVRRFDPVSKTMKMYPDPSYKGDPNVVNFRIKGEDYSIVFNEHIPRSMEIANAFKNMGTDKLSGMMAAIAPYTRYLAAINTQYNPIFGVVNFVRDAQYAMLTLASTPLQGKQLEVLNNARKALGAIYSDARDIRKGVQKTSPMGSMWQRFEHVGGPTGYRDIFMTTEARVDEIKRLMDPSAWAGIRNPRQLGARLEETPMFQLLSDYNLTMENAIRLGVFKTAVDSGMSDIAAASLAKNITVNFNKKGQLGSQMGSLYAFFNANVQGTARIAEVLFDRTKDGFTISSLGKKIITGGLLVGVLQSFMLSMGGFDDDDPPEFVKQKNLIFPVPGTDKGYIMLPMPLGFNLLPTIGRLAAESVTNGIMGRPIHGFQKTSDLLGAFFGSLSPTGGAGGIQEFAPTVLDPAVSLYTNRDWSGRKIYQEDRSSLDPTPGLSRTRDSATVWAKFAAKAINWATGGTDFTPGVYSPTPDAIDYLIGQATGGIGRETSKAAQVIQKMVGGDEVPVYKYPLGGRFAGSASGESAIRNRFYENITRANVAYNELEGRAKSHQEFSGYLLGNPAARFSKEGAKIMNTLNEIKKQKERLHEQGASHDAVKLLNDRAVALMTRFNEAMTKAEGR